MQLHWWDYAVPGVLDAISWLGDLRRAGKIRHLGLTNFDTPHVEAIAAAGVPVVSHQVQYSVLDRRAAGDMARACRRHGIGLLAYGALGGGFLSERWLGQAAPREPLENRSLVKYRLIIDECGPRVNELATAKIGDLDEHRRAIRVRSEVEKNERYRLLELPDDLFDALLATLPPREDRDLEASL